MREQGIVTKALAPQLIEVAFQRSEACKNCRACHIINDKDMAIEAINDVGARVNDVVEIDIPSAEIVRASIMVFLIPIFCLIGGYLIVDKLTSSQTLATIAGLAGLALSFFVIRWYDTQVQQKDSSRATVIKVIPSN